MREKASRFVKFKAMDSKNETVCLSVVERREERVRRYKVKRDIHMGRNNAMSFSKMEKCYLPTEIKTWLLSPKEKKKIGKRRNLANSVLGRCVNPKVTINGRLRMQKKTKKH